MPVLPHLKVLQPSDERAFDSCRGQDFCSSCALFERNGGRCGGCTKRVRDGLEGNFAGCSRDACDACAGHAVQVSSVCCRSPRKEATFAALLGGEADWNAPKFTFAPRPALSFEEKAVFYLASGGVNAVAGRGEHLFDDPPEIVAVSLQRAWNKTSGFFSRDMHDYFRLPKATKLALFAMTFDDKLEQAWEQDLHADPRHFADVGFDFWMPLSFSTFSGEANMHHWQQAIRTFRATEQSQAWWTTGDHDLPGVRTDDIVLASAKAVPQVVFNVQFAQAEDLDNLRVQLAGIRRYHKIMPAKTSFWVVGTAHPTFVANVRRQCGDRDVYFVSARPWFLASKSRRLTPAGKYQPALGREKRDLVRDNYAVFREIVRVHAA